MELSSSTISIEARCRFRAFNTDVDVIAADWAQANCLNRVEAFMHAFEARFSRFRPDSELGRLNARQSETVSMSPEMLGLIERSIHFWNLTDGIFNPLILRSLEAAGYDRSFEKLAGSSEASAAYAAPPFSLMGLDSERYEVTLPLPFGLDFGGIGKGYAVELARRLLPEGEGFLIDAGGDIYAAGDGPGGQPWQVDVADPWSPDEVIASVRLRDQAIATSWTTRRRWRSGSGWAHHLIDPRTGVPSENGVAAATVIASRTDEADVFAKTAAILGAKAGLAFLQRQNVEGLLAMYDGTQLKTPGWPGNN